MASLFGSPATPDAPQSTPPASSLRIQTSLEGKPRALFYGLTRVAANIIWNDDFFSETVAPPSSGGGGGKGALFGTPAAGGSAASQTYYFTSVVLALGEGAVAAIGPTVWTSKSITTIAEQGLGTVLGTNIQVPWSYLTTAHPDEALGYRNTALVFGNLSLGQSPELPNYSFLVKGIVSGAVAGVDDANPKDFLIDFLSNALHGVPGWSAAFNDNWNVASGYWIATGLFMSWAVTDQITANQALSDIIESLNCLPTFSEGVLKIVPRGDEQITSGAITTTNLGTTVPNTPTVLPYPYSIQAATAANFVDDLGVTYTSGGVALVLVAGSPGTGQYAVTDSGLYYFGVGDVGVGITLHYTSAALGSYNPPSQPIYDLTDKDFLPAQGSGSTVSDPVAGVRKPPRKINNIVKVEYLDRSGDYNPASVKAYDDTSIRIYGERTDKGIRSWHWFQFAHAAQQAANLALGREKIANEYVFTLRPRFIRLDCGDIVTITDPGIGLDRQWVRILDIQENQDRTINFLVEEVLQGTGASPLYGTSVIGGNIPNYNADPGPLNDPIIFEPTDELGGGLQIWIAASGSSDLFGGYDAYVSYDGTNFTFVARQFGSARMGVTTAPLPSFTINNTGPTIDTTSTLSVDLTESKATLVSGSQADALALNTSCYIDGEIISYETATLTGANKYDLTYLVRGAYGTETSISIHPTGSAFARLDANILRIPFDQSRIGSTVQIKLVPLNLWFGGPLTVTDVAPITYTIQGTALASPLPSVTNLTSKFVDGRLNATWDEIDDFRNGIRYEIRRGDTFDGALSLGTVAHPPFPFPGDGTYWVTAWCQPAAALVVRSEFPVSIEAAGATLNNNVVAIWDGQAQGWPGIFVNTGVDAGLNAVRLSGSGDVLSEGDILSDPDILNLGGIVSNGTYRPSFLVDVGRVCPVQITITMVGTGFPVGQNILGIPDILSEPDILGSASSAFVDVFPKILISQTGVGDILVDPDILGTPDILSYGIPFATGQKYSPGFYVGKVFGFEFDLSTIDPATVAALLSAVITVDVPDRVDSRAMISGTPTSLTNITVPDAGLNIVFLPDGAAAAAPFNGGPAGSLGSLPQIIATWSDEQPGDVLSITGETLAGCTVQIINTGVGVTRNKVNIFPRGY